MNDRVFCSLNDCVLIIGKEDKILSHEKLYNEMGLDWNMSRYNPATRKNESTGIYTMGDYDSMLYTCDMASSRNTVVLHTPKDRLKFIYASLHDDEAITNMVKREFLEIREVVVPALRGTSKYYLQYWMERYGFTLEDFWKNDKYTVIVDFAGSSHVIYELDELGLLNWDNFSSISEEEEEED